MPEFGFRETFSGIAVSPAFVRVTPLSGCGSGPSSIEVRARRACGVRVPGNIQATLAGRRVSLRWDGTAEGEVAPDDLVEIGTAAYASNVLTALVTASPGLPVELAADLAPGRYFARVWRRDPTCGERPIPSPEVSFEIVP